MNPAIQPLRCTNPDCTLSQGGRCARAAEFPDPVVDCPELERKEGPPPPGEEVSQKVLESEHDPLTADPEVSPTPWSGRHLSDAETERLLWRSPARLIGVLGAKAAGKTCLLTAFFLSLASGQRQDLGHRFAGSRSLHSLHVLTQKAGKWTEADPLIVDRTVVNEDDIPRLMLHLALQPEGERRVIDVLLTDIPGEWLEQWAKRADEINQRRVALLQRCDALLVLGDADLLMDPAQRRADRDLAALVGRVIDLVRVAERGASIALVFSKFDRVVQELLPPEPADAPSPEAWGPLGQRMPRTFRVLQSARELGLEVSVHAVSAFPHRLDRGQPVGVVAPFATALASADRRVPWPRRVPSQLRKEDHGFLALRRWPAEVR